MTGDLEVFKALGDSTRLKIMKLLALGGEVCVCSIMSSLKLNQAAASKALGVLKKAGLVKARRDGRWMHYRINRGGNTTAVKAAALISGTAGKKLKTRCD